MNEFIKKIILVLIVCIIPIITSYTVYAENETTEDNSETSVQENQISSYDTMVEEYDEKDAMVEINLVYVDDSGIEEIIKSGYGFFVGDREKDVYLITCYHMVSMTEEEKNLISTKYEIETSKISTKINIALKNDVMVEAAFENGSENMDFAIVKPATKLTGCTTLRVCEDANINSNGSLVYSYSFAQIATDTDASQDANKVDGQIEDWADINAAHYYKYNVSDIPQIGFPIFNENSEVIGINTQNMVMSDGYYSALQINEIIEVMKILGLEYNPEIIIDISEMESILSEYSELNPELYTTESWSIVEEKQLLLIEISETIEDGDIDYYTQDELNTAINELRISIDGLKKKEVSVSKVKKIAIIIGIILCTLIVILIIVLIVNKYKYKNRIREEKISKQSAMETLRLSGRITPGSVHNNGGNSPINRSLDNTAYVDENLSAETTVLSLNGNPSGGHLRFNDIGLSQNINYPKFTRLKTGESVIINKNTFVIGKAPELVDYCIRYNTGISRKHICIMRLEDGYYIQDLNTTNGTYVNEMRVTNDRYIKLVNGSIIKIADEEFKFTFD